MTRESTPDSWTLVQGMVSGGFVWTVCVFDGGRQFVHRVRSTCCNKCAWEAGREWLADARERDTQGHLR